MALCKLAVEELLAVLRKLEDGAFLDTVDVPDDAKETVAAHYSLRAQTIRDLLKREGIVALPRAK
jgi:hypothetical protein